MPVPIPQETDPFASPGEWVFINQQWIPIVLGTLSYALEDRYWTGDQTERSQVIQSVLKLIDGLGELLPPETVREVTRFIEEMQSDDNDNDDCEGDEMANCGSNVRFNECDGTLEYKSSDGTWLPVPPMAGDIQVGEIPDDVAPLPSGTVACAKANGLWDLTEKYFNAVIETAPPAILGYRIPATWWAEMLSEPGLSVREVETAIILGAPDFQGDWDAAIAWWDANRADIKALFICKAQDAMSKTANATDSDMAYYRAYNQWDTGSDSLDLKLYALANGIPKDSAVKAQLKAYATKPDDFVCDCVGGTPAPDPDELPTGCIRLELVKFTPIRGAWNIASETPNTLETVVDPPYYGEGDALPFTATTNTSTPGDGWQHGTRALLTIAGDHAGWFVRRIEVSFDASWASGTPQMDYVIAVATGESSNFGVSANGTTVTANPSLAANVGLQLTNIFVGIGVNTGHNVAGTARITNITLYVYPAGHPEDEEIIHFNQNACVE